MSGGVHATAINDDKGTLVFTEVEEPTLPEAQERANRVARRLEKLGRERIGIAYDLGAGRQVRLVNGDELDWTDFLGRHGLHDDGLIKEDA